MTPTADQVAHAIVAASRHYRVDPIKVAKRERGNAEYVDRSRALIYAMMAIADTFGNDCMASRLVGLVETRVSSTRWQIQNRALKWWDAKVLELVKAAIPDAPAAPPVRSRAAEAPTLPAAPKNAPLPAVRKPTPVPAKRVAPNFGTVGGMGPPRRAYGPDPSEKRQLRDMLAEAVANTAKLPSQN